MFKLNRMLELETLEETFPPRIAPWPITPAERIYSGTLAAAVRFDPAARWRLIDEYGAESFTREEDGTLLFRREFPDKEELLRWVLSFQEQAELEVVSANAPAVGLYRKLGFEDVGTMPRALKYQDGTYADFLLMVRTL